MEGPIRPPKERTLNTVGKGPHDPDTQASGQSRNGGRQPAPLTSSGGLGSGPGQPLTSGFSSSRDSVDYGPSPDHIHQNTSKTQQEGHRQQDTDRSRRAMQLH